MAALAVATAAVLSAELAAAQEALLQQLPGLLLQPAELRLELVLQQAVLQQQVAGQLGEAG